jgi:hypothetical protein
MLLLRHSVVEISRICLTVGRTLLTLPLKFHWESTMSRTSRRARTAVAAGSFLAVAMIASCGTAPVQEDASPEVVVKQRAQARWDAMVAGDLDKAYAYMSPTSREMIPLQAFRNSIRIGFWKKAQVSGITCDKDACDVTVDLTYSYRGSTIQTPARETWVKSDGAWWHVFKPA